METLYGCASRNDSPVTDRSRDRFRRSVGGVGALATALCAYKTKNVLLSMLLGVVICGFFTPVLI